MQSQVKRAIDVIVAGCALLILSPVLALVSVVIRLTSPGPVMFRQVRLGRHAHEFVLLKFRTMRVGAAHVRDGLAVSRGDARITPVGRVLRKTSLDELPQLVNVFRGELSLVGPRPTLPEQLPYYSNDHLRRFAVRPGITGLATVNGRASIPWSQRLALDVQYVDTFSLWLDLKILWRTVIVVALGRGTYYDPGAGAAFDLAPPDDLPQARPSEVTRHRDS